MSTDPQVAAPATRSWWRRIVLPLSLVLNLFLIGVIGGHVVRTRMIATSSDAPSLVRIFTNATKRMSAADAAKFDAAIGQNSAAYAESAKKLAASRDELRRQILAEPFDRTATRKAYIDWQQDVSTFASNVGESLIQALSEISPEGRHQLMAGRPGLMSVPADDDNDRSTDDKKPDEAKPK